MKIHIHRGQNQIGGNIIEIATDTTKILLDVVVAALTAIQEVVFSSYINNVLSLLSSINICPLVGFKGLTLKLAG